MILTSEEWMEPHRLSHGADVSIHWDKAHAQGMARAQEVTIFNVLSVIIICRTCEEEGRRPLGGRHCHGFISQPQSLGHGPLRTLGTFAKWLLGSRKAEGKCCLRLFDLWRGWGTCSCCGRWGGGCGFQARLPLPAAHCLWDIYDSPSLSLSLCPSLSSPAHRAGQPSEKHEATRKHRSFLSRWGDPASSGKAVHGLATALGKSREPGVWALIWHSLSTP